MIAPCARILQRTSCADVVALGRWRDLPDLARARLSFHTRDQLSPFTAHIDPRGRLPLHTAIDLSGGAPSRQQGHRVHQRLDVLPGHAVGDQRSHPLDQHGAICLPAREDCQPVRERVVGEGAARRDSHDRRRRHRQPEPVGSTRAPASKSRMPYRVVSAPALVFAREVEQPDPPRTARRRWQRGSARTSNGFV